MSERLQKFLSRAGVASRRKAEELIVAGRVRVGGRVVTELGTRVDPRRDRVDVDGRRVLEQTLVYVVLHKPRGVMCTLSDPEGRRTVVDLIGGVGVRVAPVGRLDYHTSGVLLLTNDGDFASVLAHPKKGAPKVYVAKLQGVVDERGLERLGESIEIDGRKTERAEVTLLRVEGDKTWVEVTLREGRNRQVRRLGDAAGLPVMRLARTEFAGIGVDGLRPGQWRHLTKDELVLLKQTFGVPMRIHTPPEGGAHGRVQRRPGARPAGERSAGPRPEPPRRPEARPPRRGKPERPVKRPSRAGATGRGRRS
jgi:23S rRNA pseudouridine2605 synthase